jgi:hypothetical protein
MAADEREEQAARARGDINRGALATVCGASIGGALALAWVARARLPALDAFARDALSMKGAPPEMLRALFSRVAEIAWPVAVAAGVGALAVGLAQTRGFVARLGLGEPPERRTPNPILALLGWIALGVLALDGLSGAFGLAVDARPGMIAVGAAVLAERLARMILLGVAVLALLDHLLRAQARSARLVPEPSPRAQIPREAEPGVDELLTGAVRVLYDGDRALVIGQVSGTPVALVRVTGLTAHALLDAARRRGLPVRAGTGLGELALGQPVAVERAS